MTYKSVRITELMTYEFGQIEGDFNHCDEQRLKSAIPRDMSFEQFKEQLRQGHLVLLHDIPVSPLLVKGTNNIGDTTWELNTKTNHDIEPMAQQALLARTRIAAQGSAPVSRNLSPPLPMPPYTPEPLVPERFSRSPELKYEYNFEIACSEESLRGNAKSSFILAKTEQEESLSDWRTTRTKHGIRYTVFAAVDEPKRFIAQILTSSFGISLKTPIRLHPRGSNIVLDGYIPVMPAVQIGERLGFPIEGYYYHFSDGELIQEYKIIGQKRWQFYATCSRRLPDMSYNLNDEQDYHPYQHAILVFWKIAGEIVDNQYIVYLEQKITEDELNNIHQAWLVKHGMKLDIPTLLAVTKQPVLPRAENTKTVTRAKIKTHIVQRDPKTGQRELWPTIAKNYNLTPIELLSLNCKYNADPMSLKVGDTLNLEKREPFEPTPVFGFPPQLPQSVNHPLNVYYEYSSGYLLGGAIQAINRKSYVADNIPVVNVKTALVSPIEFALGFAIIDRAQPLDDYWQELFTDETSYADRVLIKKYNTHLNDPVRQGEIVVLPTSEPITSENQSELDNLLEDAGAVSSEVNKLSEEQVATANYFFELLDYYSSLFAQQVKAGMAEPIGFYTHVSMGVSVSSAIVEQHLKNINNVLREINNLYVTNAKYITGIAGFDRRSFLTDRAALFKKLDQSFARLSQRTIKMSSHQQVKKALGLSTRSLIHNAKDIAHNGIIPNLGKRMANVMMGLSKAKFAGHVGVALGAIAGINEIYKACTIDDVGQCGKVATHEISSFLGSWEGGIVGGKLAVGGMVLVLKVVGVTSVPVLAVAIITAFAVGGIFGSLGGGALGGAIGDVIYEIAIDIKEWSENKMEWLSNGVD